MSSTIKTPNIELNQWSQNENPKRLDFVNDNKKIDDAYAKLKNDIDSKATDAEGTSYNNTNSKLTSTNVQGAIDEVNTKSEQNKTSILEHSNFIKTLQDEVLASKNVLFEAINRTSNTV